MVLPKVNAFDETAALYALMTGRRDNASRIVGNMSPPERADFALRLDELRSMLTDELGNDAGDSVTQVPRNGRGETFEEAWARWFKDHPEVRASWSHQNGYWPENSDGEPDSRE